MKAAAQATHLALAVIWLCGVGCEGSSDSVSVEGRVSVQGQPLSHGVVTFIPAAGRTVTASTDEAGNYATELPSGDYRVTLSVGVQLPPGWKEGDTIPAQKVTLPTQYSSRINTPLKMAVAEGGAEPTDFTLP